MRLVGLRGLWVTQCGEPIVGRDPIAGANGDAGQLEWALTGPLAACEDARTVPQDEQIEPVLGGAAAAEAASAPEVGAQDTVDGLTGRTDANRPVEQTVERLSRAAGFSVAMAQGLDVRGGLAIGRPEPVVTTGNSALQAPGAGGVSLEEIDHFGVGELALQATARPTRSRAS